ncbi:hypothetical protein [Aquimarina sp. Aq107]|uniref:hypothetical protein n=1 Tax=Aquimarina sp. Aq107 TaxID=1191912 RepID=UPI000D550357|nr:hypothetical protein [Aquimarina sp. Aq107]
MLAQIDANSLMGLPTASTAERVAITGVSVGALVYDTDVNRVYEFTDTGWQEMLTTGNVYVGAFQVSSSGTINITGIPFRPTLVTFVAHANVEDFNINNDNGTANNDRGIRNSFGTMNGFARNDPGDIIQQVIYIGSHGNSINDISRFASDMYSIGLRYGDQNGLLLGNILGDLTDFNSDGFTINITYIDGDVTNVGQNVLPEDIDNEGIIVLYTAYR